MRSGLCRHYNGSFHNETCEAGVRYKDVTPRPDEPGSKFREPCNRQPSEHGLRVLQNNGPQGVCDKYEPLTEAELREEALLIEAMQRRMALLTELIARVKREHKGEDWRGVTECPVCQGGLHVSHAAYNGHVHGRCETAGCVSWME